MIKYNLKLNPEDYKVNSDIKIEREVFDIRSHSDHIHFVQCKLREESQRQDASRQSSA